MRVNLNELDKYDEEDCFQPIRRTKQNDEEAERERKDKRRSWSRPDVPRRRSSSDGSGEPDDNFDGTEF